MTTPSGNGGKPEDRAPKCVTGEESHVLLHRQRTPGGPIEQVCGKCNMTPLQIKLHGYDQLLSHLVAAVMMMLNEYGDQYKPMMHNLLNAAAYSGHGIVVKVEPEPGDDSG